MYTPIGMGAAKVVGPGGITPTQGQEIRALLPPCYSQEMATCWQDEPSNLPNCSEINQWAKVEGGEDYIQGVLDDEMDYCPVPGSGPAPSADDVLLPPGAGAEGNGKRFSIGEAAIYASVAGLLGLGLGYVLGS